MDSVEELQLVDIKVADVKRVVEVQLEKREEYKAWKKAMEVVLYRADAEGYLDGSILLPLKPEGPLPPGDESMVQFSKNLAIYMANDKAVKSALLACVHDSLFDKLGDWRKMTSYEIWNWLQKEFKEVSLIGRSLAEDDFNNHATWGRSPEDYIKSFHEKRVALAQYVFLDPQTVKIRFLRGAQADYPEAVGPLLLFGEAKSLQDCETALRDAKKLKDVNTAVNAARS